MAGILCFAALLKLIQIVEGPGVKTWSMALPAIELLLAIWLLSNLQPGAARIVASLAFTVFAIVSASRVYAGVGSCGCFGSFVVAPLGALVLDCSVVIAFAVCTPECSLNSARRFLARGAVALLMVAMTCAGAQGRLGGRPAAEGIGLEQLVGQQFPMLERIDIRDDLSQGRWVVLLHRHGCARCASVIPGYRALAADLERIENAPRVSLVEVGGRQSIAASAEGGTCIEGTMSGDGAGVTTPLEITLENGVLVAYRVL